MKKLRCLFISRFAPERTRTDPHTGMPWYLSERTQLTGVWGKPEHRKVGFQDHCERVIEVNLRQGGWLKSTWALVKLAHLRLRPDVVLCGVDEWSLIVGLLAGGIFRAPVFSFVEDPVFTDRYRLPVGWSRRLERRVRTPFIGSLLEHCAGIFCFVEKSVLEEFDLRSPQIYQMMNGVSPQAMSWAQNRSGKIDNPRKYTVGFVGAIHPKQGVDTFLEIFAEVRKGVGDIRLRLIGPMDESYVPHYQKGLRNYGLQEAVEVTGWLPYERMLGKLQECQIGVYCNQPNEWARVAQPLKICEYLALEKPIVAWDYPGVRRLLDGGRLGVLVPPGDRAAFADGVVCLADPGRRAPIECAIRQAVRARWASDYWYGQLLEQLTLAAPKGQHAG